MTITIILVWTAVALCVAFKWLLNDMAPVYRKRSPSPMSKLGSGKHKLTLKDKIELLIGLPVVLIVVVDLIIGKSKKKKKEK